MITYLEIKHLTLILKKNKTLAFSKERWYHFFVFSRISKMPFFNVWVLFYSHISQNSVRRIGHFFSMQWVHFYLCLYIMLLNERNTKGENEVCFDMPTGRGCILVTHVILLEDLKSIWKCSMIKDSDLGRQWYILLRISKLSRSYEIQFLLKIPHL